MNKLLTMTALLATFALVSCNGANNPSHESGLSTPEATSEASKGEASHESGLSIPGETSSESQPQETYTAAKVAADTNTNLANEGYSELALEYDSQYDEWWTYCTLGEGTDESESALQAVAVELAIFLPDYMQENAIGLYGDPNDDDYYDYWDDNSIYYLIMCVSPDGAVCAESVSCVSEGGYYASLYIYDVAE